MRIFAFDLDGTVLREHAKLSEANSAAFEELHRHGVVLVPATGRIHNFLPEPVLDLPGLRYLITSNGASVYDLREEKVIYENLIEPQTALRVQQVLEDFGVYVEYYHGGEVLLEKKYQSIDLTKLGVPADREIFFRKKYHVIDSYRGGLQAGEIRPEKINLPYIQPAIYEALWAALEKLPGIHLTSSVQGNIEINRDTCNKGSALQFLAEYLSVERAQVMAIGDGGNDVEMLAWAGISVAMGNGVDAAKEAAAYITAPCDEDGLAKAVQRFLV